MAKAKPAPVPKPEPRPAEYTVVARRYRPQQFTELIGQEHVAQSLVNALQSGRVAHAYLFTGARGVGKTSAARILAKALNCVKGPTPTPCDECDNCKAIAVGQDADVVEIDAASNRGIDDARELRQSVGFRPTSGRYKIYIIDEVHMLTREAFNALLKTLEEPPPHVKFILATTDVQKIPITILSRCQRFDFAHVGPARIFEQLKAIVQREGHQADDDALRLVARRAAGSMRDSQSLLDQLLASAEGKLTAEQVHAVLGTAGEERVAELAGAIIDRDTTRSLNLLTAWVDRGLQVGELMDQLIEYWRGLMLLKCAPDLQELPVSTAGREILCQNAGKLSLDTILAGLDVWTTTKARSRGSSHAAVLLEMAVVRLCRLDELLSVGQLVQDLAQGGGVSTGSARNGSTGGTGTPSLARPPETGDPSKKNGVTGVSASGNGHASPPDATIPLSQDSISAITGRLLRLLTDRSPLLASQLKFASHCAIFGPNSLAIRFHSRYTQAYDACRTEENVARIEDSLRKITGQKVIAKLELGGGPEPEAPGRPAPGPAKPVADRKKQLMTLPLFKKAGEVLGAQIWHVDHEFNPVVLRPDASPASAEPDEPDDLAVPAPDEG